MNDLSRGPTASKPETQRISPAPILLPDGETPVPFGSGTITRLLGRGGNSSVYEIWNSQLEIYRAVKVINPNAADAARQRFQTEFKICAKLKHPNIVEIHGVGQWNGLPYIEMEKVDGTGLDHIIAQRGALPAAVCTSVGILICKALEYAHTQPCTLYGVDYQGIIHRDLKPQNIMVCSTGAVKLMDFGIARPIDTSFKTIDGLISGTLQFLSPEQLEKGNLDFRTDLYSLGVTLFEMITGVNPFPQSGFVDLVSHKTKNKYLSLEAFPVTLPSRLKRLIYKCMNHDPPKRGNSAQAVLTDLTKIHKGMTKKTPEEIIARFLSEANGSKVILRPRRHLRLRTTASAASVLLFVFCLYSFGLLDKHKERLRRTLAETAAVYGKNIIRFLPLPPPKPIRQTAEAEVVKKITVNTSRIGAIAPQPAPAPPPALKAAKKKRAKLLLESAQADYGTENNLVILEKAWREKNYSTVLAVFDFLPPEQARAPQALIYKLRSLDAMGDRGQLLEFLDNTDLNDGEFYCAKARVAFQNKNIPGCRLLLKIAFTSPHVLLEYDALQREVYYMLALCASAIFDAEPMEQSYKEALDAWWQLKSVLRSDPNHPYNKKAADEQQRMAKLMQKG